MTVPFPGCSCASQDVLCVAVAVPLLLHGWPLHCKLAMGWLPTKNGCEIETARFDEAGVVGAGVFRLVFGLPADLVLLLCLWSAFTRR